MSFASSIDSATQIASATQDASASVPPPPIAPPNITQIIVAITSNNTCVQTLQGFTPEAEINRQLKPFNLPNLVLPTGVILYGSRKGDVIRFEMDTRIKNIDLRRFISPNQFNEITENSFTIPINPDFKKGTLLIIVRHGKSGHNELEDVVQKNLGENTDLVDELLTLAQKRNPDLDFSQLTKEENLKLAFDTYRQDAELTPTGIEEVKASACLIESFLNHNFLMRPQMILLSSHLERTKQSAGLIGSHLGYKGVIIPIADANESDREIGATYWHMGTPQRDIVNEMKRIRGSNMSLRDKSNALESMMFEAVTTILKNPPKLSREEWEQLASKDREPLEERVRKVWRENIPCCDGPSTQYGIPIVYRPGSYKDYGDLIKALSRYSKILHFCSGNKRKLMDIEGVFGKHLCMVPYEGDEAQGKPLYVASAKAIKMHKKLDSYVLTEDVSMGEYGRESAADALIKYHVEEAAGDGVSLKTKMERRFGGAEFYSYRSSCVFTDGTRTFKTWSIAKCTLKELTKEEKEGVVGDIDPFVVVYEIETWRQIDDNDPQPVGSIVFDASDNLSIGQKQAQDPQNRFKLHPRIFALREMKLELAQLGIMW
jgi:bisphosphoglycerate-dependent phosphoglycerate mutase